MTEHVGEEVQTVTQNPIAHLEPNETEADDSELGAQEGAADTLPILEEVSTVEPEEMFSAMVTIIRANSGEQPREEWVTSIAELYAIIHRTVSIEEDIVPPNKKR
ncbi:hypothetical protein PInf_007962 [Phytophthora infestans]|nr:hypothetical protein PInf_007962 [Phytophthora infestans]